MDRILPLSGHNLRSLGQTFARLDHFYQARFRNRFGKLVNQLAKYIPREGVILDIGANHGKFTRNFARVHGGSCRVLAFEPLEYNYSLLRAVVGAMKNVSTFNIALSDRAGTTDFYVPIRPSGRISPGCAHMGDESHADSFGTSTAKEVRKTTVATETLDAFLQRQGIDRLDFIKLDVQGAESLVIQGGMSSLRTYKPAIWCELSRGCPEYLGLTVNNAVDLLASLGYKLHTLDERTGECRGTPFTDSIRDYLLLHEERTGR
jgi:FkbM family methyltransferase